MPRINWGSNVPKKKDVESYDRSGQRYMGPTPANGAYRGAIKVLKFVKERGKKPHLRVGLELVPRNKNEKKYAGYFLMDFLYIVPGAEFRFVPFLDAIGVTYADLLEKGVSDEDGNVLKVGKWVKKNAEDVIFSFIDKPDENGNSRKEVNGYAPLDAAQDEDEDEDGDDSDDDDEWDDDSEDEEESDDEDFDDEDEEEDEEDEPEPPRKKAKAKKRR